MGSEVLPEIKPRRKQVFHRVAETLYRLEPGGGYYALLKRGDKQYRRSLRTKDRKLAERRLVELRAQVGNLTLGDEAKLTFEEVATRWKDATQHGLNSSHAVRSHALASKAPAVHVASMLNWADCSAVERVPGKVSGAWLFRGTRVPVKALFENLESGATVAEFLDLFPGVTQKQVEAVLEYAQRSLVDA